MFMTKVNMFNLMKQIFIFCDCVEIILVPIKSKVPVDDCYQFLVPVLVRFTVNLLNPKNIP